MADRVYHLALRELHEAAGARFGPREGWSVPLHYGDAEREYRALRESAILADRSYRSRLLVTGTDALETLRAALPGHLDELEEGRCARTARLDTAGNIRDLLLVARTGGIAYQVAGESGQREQTLDALRGVVQPDWDVRIDDRTESTCCLAIAGPRAAEVIAEHLSDALPARLQLLHTVVFEFHGFRTMATRTGDAGEDGFEFTVAPAVAQHMLEVLREAGVPLAGYQALEAARVETCIPAYAPDLEPGLSPAEAGIDALFAIPGGSEARALVPLILDASAPLPPGTPLSNERGRIGTVRSCVRSFALDAVVALALVERRMATPGTELDAAGVLATVVVPPLYRRRS